jgi:hypothetical protein
MDECERCYRKFFLLSNFLANVLQSLGKELYDDYMEHEPGALEALRDYLSTSAYRSKTGPQRHQDRTPAQSVPSSSFNNSSIEASSFGVVDNVHQGNDDPVERIGANQYREDIELGDIPTHTLYLLSCMEKGMYAVYLHQELVTRIADDRELFRTLRKTYQEHRGRLRPYWSLRTVRSIHFMKVSALMLILKWKLY